MNKGKENGNTSRTFNPNIFMAFLTSIRLIEWIGDRIEENDDNGAITIGIVLVLVILVYVAYFTSIQPESKTLLEKQNIEVQINIDP
jgi:quinol-cytochrome oxidoreductase complex cytochrome b subunit